MPLFENLLVSAMPSAGTYAGYHIMLLNLEATTWVTGEIERNSDSHMTTFVSALRKLKVETACKARQVIRSLLLLLYRQRQ